jgi:hypothetical protein
MVRQLSEGGARRRGLAARDWLVAVVSALALLGAAPAAAAPSYFSYFGLADNLRETQDHVNLYWAVSWTWDRSQVVTQLANARTRGMRAIVHTEFAFFEGSGPYGNGCPYTLRPDAAQRWDAFVRSLWRRGLLDTVAAFYPLDEPDLCGVPSGDVLTVLGIIRAHPLTAGRPVAAIFTCDVAEKYDGIYRLTGEHKYGDALRAYDWVGFDCYGVGNIFTEPAWKTVEFDSHCFCFRTVDGPSYYDNFKAQLDFPRQRLMLVPQGFIAPDSNGAPDDPQLFADRANADAAVVLLVPFTWFDHPEFAGVRSQPALAQAWREIGKGIANANPPRADPPLPVAIPPRLAVAASDVQQFAVYDYDCETTPGDVCSVQLHWQAPAGNPGTQLFVRVDGAAPQFLACAATGGFFDAPWITAGVHYAFEVYAANPCTGTIAAGAVPLASVAMTLGAAPMSTGPVGSALHQVDGVIDNSTRQRESETPGACAASCGTARRCC